MSGLILTIVALASGPPAEDATLKVDASRVLNRVTPLMYGSCIEDVNHEIYGGLYAQKIFGESFEEPPRSAAPRGWSAFGGQWGIDHDELSVKAELGPKLVRDEGVIGDGSVSCEVRFPDGQGDNAGIIVRVDDPRVGADAWIGYEISLSARRREVLLGRHKNDWHLLKTARFDVVPGRWHRLRAELNGPQIRVFLDDAKEPSIAYDDGASALPPGRVGVRTWGSDASYRNFAVEGRSEPFARRSADGPGREVSGMWDLVLTGDATPGVAWDADRPFNTAHSQRIERTGGSGTVGVANRGLNRWGLGIRAGRTYAGRVHLRQEGYAGRVRVALQGADGAKTYAAQTLDDIRADWSRHDFTLTSPADDTSARLALWVDGPGKVWVDQAYLAGTGDDLFRGLPVRGDLGRGLQAQGLTVLRYGGLMANAPDYRWKNMIGDPDRRPQYRGYWYPHSTHGFGIEDFVRFCRAAGFEPVVAVNVLESPEDAADLVEYLNGPATTTWGRRRAENGHAEPYGVKYIEVGNEELTNPLYIERFHRLYDAMRPRDPSVQYILACWWEPDDPVTKRVVQELGEKASLWDVHVGGDDPREGAKVDALFTRMENLVREWSPGTKLKACILEENGGKHDLARALGHASVVNAAQRHGDFVLIDCPANCLQAWEQNDNDWDQGQLFYTPDRAWGMPPYHAQKMASSAHLPCRVACEVAGDLDATVTRDEAGSQLVLKVVNAGDAGRVAAIAIDGFGPIAPEASATVLSGHLRDVNSPGEPGRIAPREAKVPGVSRRFTHEFPAQSYTILRMRRAD